MEEATMKTTMTAIAIGGVALALACQAHVSGGISVGAQPTAQCCSNSFAAMDEIPVEGGELRLVEIEIVPGDTGASLGDVTPGAAPAKPHKAIGLPLKHTDVKVQVAQMMAVYTVTQTFENPFTVPIDAVYVFPLGSEAAVSGFAMTIGERTITGQIQGRAEARRTFESARTAGHTAALVEQEKTNVFAQRIANIAPRETIKVRFEYSELLDYADGQYTVAFPLVVGPRYLPEARVGASPVGSHPAGASGRAGVTSVPYLADNRDASTVSFTADIDAGVPLHGIASPSHDVDVTDVSPTRARATLHAADEIPNRDLIMKYRVAGDRTMVGVLGHRTTADDGAFVLVVQPKAEYRTGDVAARDVMIVIDKSGSMEGVPLDQAKQVAAGILGTLTPRDTFNILAFSDGIQSMSPAPIAGDATGVRAGHTFLGAFESGGGTEMEQGLLQALQSEPSQGRIRIVYLLSDAFVGNDDVVLSAARGVLGHNRIFPVGIGSSTNRALIDQLAAIGRGFPSYLTPAEDPATLVPELVRRSAYPYLTNVTIDWGGLAVEHLTPERIPDVYAGLPMIVSGHYKRAGTATVVIRGIAGATPVEIPLQVTLPERLSNPAIASLWARRRIEALSLPGPEGISDGAVREIEAIGLTHHLVTPYTSFVAVDKARVVQPGGAFKIVEQPAALPEGVNLGAIGGGDSEDPLAVAAGGASSSSSSSYASNDDDYYGGGGSGWGGGGGAVDPLTLLLALGVVPLGRALRRRRAAA
jgi:Ca-activated chloride channel family protein